MSEIQDRIAAALAATPAWYLEKTLASRQPGTGVGSRFLVPTTVEDLASAEWEVYAHPAVQAPAVTFRAPIPGMFGMVRLDSLDPDACVMLEDAKHTGQVTPVIPGAPEVEVDFTTILLGEDEGKEIVFSFFPGEPVRPSTVPATGLMSHGTLVAVARAIALGLEWAKLGG